MNYHDLMFKHNVKLAFLKKFKSQSFLGKDPFGKWSGSHAYLGAGMQSSKGTVGWVNVIITWNQMTTKLTKANYVLIICRHKVASSIFHLQDYFNQVTNYEDLYCRFRFDSATWGASCRTRGECTVAVNSPWSMGKQRPDALLFPLKHWCSCLNMKKTS